MTHSFVFGIEFAVGSLLLVYGSLDPPSFSHITKSLWGPQKNYESFITDWKTLEPLHK